MNIRPWAVEVMYPPIYWLDLPDDLRHGGTRIVKRFWTKKRAEWYCELLKDLAETHPSEAYRSQMKGRAYYVVRTR